MKKINFLKPDNKNLPLFLTLGTLLFLVGILDFYLNNFLNTNITSFLPRFINFFTPLIFAVMGLHFVRIEFSGIKILDSLNKNINTSNFNAVLSVIIILLVIFSLPPLLNWLIFDANIVGDTKEACTVVELAGFILKFGSIDSCMGCILMLSNGELMLHLF